MEEAKIRNKVTFEFYDDIENHVNIRLIIHRRQIYYNMNELNEYRRSLDKYETRDEIPVEEIIRKLDEIILNDYNAILC